MTKLKITFLFLFSVISVINFSSTARAEESLLPDKPNSAWVAGQAGQVKYLIYTPKAKKENLKSMMIALHGCGQKAQDLADLANWEATADKNNMVVVLPDVPNGGVVLGCWDYYGHDHNENNRHNVSLIQLTEKLMAKKKMKIDKARVYLMGLSSGSGQAAVLGCLRPDLYSGIGLNAGPAIGTEKGDLYKPNTTSDQVAEFCLKLAGSKVDYLSRQKTSVIVSDQDFIVNPLHSVLLVEAAQKFYRTTGSMDLDLNTLKGPNTQGRGLLYADAKNKVRISYIINNGLGHAFPSGKGTGRPEKYINPNSIDYPAYLAEFFEADFR